MRAGGGDRSRPAAGAGATRVGLRWAALLGVLALALLGIVWWESAALVGRTVPGFLAWDNGVLPAFHREDWSGARAGAPGSGWIVSVDGAPFAGGAALLAHAAAREPGTPIAYEIEGFDGVQRRVSVPTMRFGWVDHTSTFAIYLGVAAVLFVVAIVALLLRPDAEAARAVALSSGNLGLVLALSADFLCGYRLTWLYPIAEAALPGTLAWFALTFPTAGTAERVPAWRRRLGWAVLLPLLGVGVVQSLIFRRDPALHYRITEGIYLLLAASLVGVVASCGWQLVASRSAEARMRAGVVFAGALASATPAAVLLSARFLLGWSFSVTWVVAIVPFLPISILYAVVYRDLLAAERFIRLTTGYAFATTAIVGAYLAIVLAFDWFALSGSASGPLASLGLLLALALGLDPLRARVQRAIDRVFFRTEADVGRVLERTSTEFALLLEEDAIHARVQEVLREELSLEWAELSPPLSERPDAVLVQRVEFRGASLGVLCCGPKRSGAPFSAAERELVRGVANQAALALQNARTFAALRAAQDDLVRQERFAAIGELSAAVAHGLRNPLAGIRAAAQVAHEIVTEEAATDALSDVLSEVDRLDSRVRTLLDFSRPFEPHLEDLDICEIVRVLSRGLATAARARGVDFSLDLPREPVKARVDPNLLEEAVQELAGNALRALEPGGKLVLRLETAGERAVLRVEDDGRGIPEGVRARIFDPFFTTRADGTGMGLPTVKKLIERQGGRVGLERSTPAGSVFRVEIPLAPGDAPRP